MGILRFFLAMSVLTGHAGLRFFGVELLDSTAAVLVFFAISGFLMALILTGERYQCAGGRTAFYVTRALRIYPLYWVLLAATILAGMSGLIDIGIDFNGGKNPLGLIAARWPEATFESRAIIVFTNLTTIFQDLLRTLGYDAHRGAFIPWTGSGEAARQFGIVCQAWTLGVELLFYLLAPFIVRDVRRLLGAMLLFAILRHFMGAWPVSQGIVVVLTSFGSFLTYMPFFLTGAALCHLFVTRKGPQFIAVAACAFGFALVIRIGSQLAGHSAVYVTVLIAAIPLLFLKFKWRADGFLGELAYPIYITHFLIMQACRQHLPATAYPVVVITAVLGVSALSVKLITEPLDRYRHALGSRITQAS